MEIYEAALGDCVVCGQDAEGSLYWTPPLADVWAKVREHVAYLFADDMTQNIFFIKPHSKPFCSPECGLRYRENDDGNAD